MSDIIKIKKEYLSKLNNDLDLNSINQIKSELFGKSGKISNEFKKMGSISVEERKKFAHEQFYSMKAEKYKGYLANKKRKKKGRRGMKKK